jgi:hypothetical protein
MRPPEHRSSAVIVVVIGGIAILTPNKAVRKKNLNFMFCSDSVMVGMGPPGRPA